MTKTTADKLNDIQRSIDLNEKSINAKSKRIMETAERLMADIARLTDVQDEDVIYIAATYLSDSIANAAREIERDMERIREYQTELRAMKDIVEFLGE